jgi:hypothetical protein
LLDAMSAPQRHAELNKFNVKGRLLLPRIDISHALGLQVAGAWNANGAIDAWAALSYPS